MRRISILRAGALLSLLGVATPIQARVAATQHQRLWALFQATDEADLRRNPFAALARGDLRHADEIGAPFSDAHFEAQKAADLDALRRLRGISPAALDPADRIAYRAFEADLQRDLDGYRPDVLKITKALPINHFIGFHQDYADLSSGQGRAPFKTVLDYENGLKRHDQFAKVIDDIIMRFRQGMAEHIVHPKLVVRNIIDQLAAQTDGGVTDSPYYGPVREFPDTIPPEERTRLRAAYIEKIRDVVFPALARLKDFLKTEYLPAARDTVGVGAFDGGEDYYRYMIERNTTLHMTAAEVHALGLVEVRRIKVQMDDVRKAEHFTGDLPAFFHFMGTDAQFVPPSREWIAKRYAEIGAQIDKAISGQFSLLPHAAIIIRPEPVYKEASGPGAEYVEGSVDGSRPGVFYYNATANTPTWGMETLYLHEAVPGHHLQTSLAQENAALPNFMRFSDNPAFSEGWALYAETLWHELGVESDPASRFGGLNKDMHRALRLVVDTGIHAKGWSREQAIDYMMSNSAMTRGEISSEVDRYIAIPGQALAYKIGALTISTAKAKAQATLGAQFDPRAFHAEILSTGALPLPVLRQKLDAWTASRAQSMLRHSPARRAPLMP